jgi:hypothetical protein
VTPRQTWKSIAAGTGALAVGVVLAGCSSSPTPGATGFGGQGGGQGEITLTAQVSLGGADRFHGSFTDKEPYASCADYLAGQNTSFGWNGPQTNSPYGSTEVGLQNLGLTIQVPHSVFKGASTYRGGNLFQATVNTSTGSTIYEGKLSILTINADGSGSLSFANATLIGLAGGPYEAGIVTWTCSG